MADKPKKIIPDADYKRLMPKFRTNVISESAAKRLGLTSKPALKTPPVKKPTSPKADPPPKKVAPKVLPPEIKKPAEPKAKPSVLKKKVVDDAPITISKGKRGATKWRKGNGPWRYDEPPAQHKPKVAEPRKEEAKPKVVEVPVKAIPKSEPTTDRKALAASGLIGKKPAASSNKATAASPAFTTTWTIGGTQDNRSAVTDVLTKLKPHISQFLGRPHNLNVELLTDRQMRALTGIKTGSVGGAFSQTSHKMYVNAGTSGGVVFGLAHELGHALDFAASDMRGTPLSSHGTSLRDTGSSLSRTAHPRLLPLARALENSAELKTLRTARANPRLNQGAKNTVEYLLLPTEIFARAFSQWVVQRYGPAGAKLILAERETSKDRGKIPHQWSPDEFGPISREFDKLFG